ncbi:LysR family transcriptional regulator [Vreelandella venusta]|uniref:LysR family transcriptional regulator n=1 Tax=Vreelandella venusta TaxID=44935 RepID=UPI0018DACBC8|nr:LysR family transcriptional regulator [Halomonas venusta]QPI63883.1 LysR family transcriptional regulator [Halomonas venusta]WAM55393.1 LysR family transcriptional regulator [Halomonas venusta]
MTETANIKLATRLHKINLNLLLVFHTLYGKRSLTLTAEALCLSQPAVSHSLKKLRLLMDDPLFIKTLDGMQPTPLARQMDAAVAKGLFYFDQAVYSNSEFSPATSKREFRVSLVDYVSQQLQPKLIQHCLTHAPDLCFNMLSTRIASAEDAQHAIQAHDIDLAMVQLESLPLTSYHEYLFDDVIGCVGDASLYGDNNTITLDAFLNAPQIALSHREDSPLLINEKLRILGLERKIVAKTPYITPLQEILVSTNLLCVVTESAAKVICRNNSLKFYALPLDVAPFKVCLCWDERKDHDSGIHWLRSLIRELITPAP